MNKMEMVDSVTGDVWCTWIASGEWQKIKGDCVSVDATLQPAQQLVPEESTTQQPIETETAGAAGAAEEQPAVQEEEVQEQAQEQVQEAVQQAVEQVQEAAEESQKAANEAKQAAKSAQQAANKAQQQISNQVQKEVQEQIQEQVVPLVQQQPAEQEESAIQEEPVEEPAVQEQPVVEEAPVVQEEAPTIGDVIQETAAGLLNSMWRFLNEIIGLGVQKVSSIPFVQNATAGLINMFNQAKTEAEVSLTQTTPYLIQSSTAGLLDSLKNVSGPLQDLWFKIEGIIKR